MTAPLKFRDYSLNISFPEGAGAVNEMPNAPGVYAEIHRPTNYIRVGHAADMKSRNKSHLAWAEKHRLGTHTKPSEVTRSQNGNSEITEVAKKWGAQGLEYYVVCDEPRLSDPNQRKDVENFMHEWCRNQDRFYNMNREAAQNRLKV